MMLTKKDGWTEELKVGDRVIERGAQGWSDVCREMVVSRLTKTIVYARHVRNGEPVGDERPYYRGSTSSQFNPYAREGWGRARYSNDRACLYPATAANLAEVGAVEQARQEDAYVHRCRGKVARAFADGAVTFAQAKQIAEILGLEVGADG